MRNYVVIQRGKQKIKKYVFFLNSEVVLFNFYINTFITTVTAIAVVALDSCGLNSHSGE